MIHGRVNSEFEPIVSIGLRRRNGEFARFDVKFDTGFNGELGLPVSILNDLENTPIDVKVARFANGTYETVNVYEVDVLIDGEVRQMTALDLGDGSRLLGMKALLSWTGCVEFKVNGDVTIRQPLKTILNNTEVTR